MTLRRWFEIVEREHAIQNPTSVDKLVWLGELLRLSPASRVLDLASGRGGPAVILAQRFGCRVTGFELREEFFRAAEDRVRQAGLDSNVRFVHADARTVEVEPSSYDVAMCLGATFVWDGLAGTLAALEPAARPGGHVVVGEPYWRTWPLPEACPVDDDAFASLAETAAAFERAGLALVGVIASSEDDWDRYESLHWRAAEEWLAENPDDPEREAMRRQHLDDRDRYLQWQRALLGWAIFVGRKG